MDNKQIIRNGSMDLLRIVAALSVAILHFSTAHNGALKYVVHGTVNYYYLMFICSLCCVAVNVFILLSGYFGIEKNSRKLSKIFYILSLTILVRLIFYTLNIRMGIENFSLIKFVRVCLPINYYIILYLTLYIISPYINIVLQSIEKKQYLKLIFVIFFLFSVWNFSLDCIKQFLGRELLNPLSTVSSNGSNGGYTIVNFMMLYIMGGYIRKYNVKIKTKLILSVGILCWVMIFGMAIVSEAAWNYNNPIVIVLAVSVLLVFKNLTINISIISKMSKGTLGCYLIHVYVIEYLNMEIYSVMNLFAVMMIQFVFSACMYLFSWMFVEIVDFAMKPILYKVIQMNEKYKIGL